MGSPQNANGGAVWQYMQSHGAAALDEIAAAVGIRRQDARRLLRQLEQKSEGADEWIEYDEEDDVYYYHDLR